MVNRKFTGFTIYTYTKLNILPSRKNYCILGLMRYTNQKIKNSKQNTEARPELAPEGLAPKGLVEGTEDKRHKSKGIRKKVKGKSKKAIIPDTANRYPLYAKRYPLPATCYTHDNILLDGRTPAPLIFGPKMGVVCAKIRIHHNRQIRR